RHLRGLGAGIAVVEQTRVVRTHGGRGAVAVPAGTGLCPRRRRRVAGRAVPRGSGTTWRPRAAGGACCRTAARRAVDCTAAELPSERHAAGHPRAVREVSQLPE